MPCFWCNVKFSSDCLERKCTKDHIIPVALGGSRHRNIVDACYECNHERGTIVDYMLLLETIAHKGCKKSTYDKVMIRHPVMLERQKKWATIEYKILRRSPTADFNLDVPEVVKFIADADTTPNVISKKPQKKKQDSDRSDRRGYGAILKEARRIAEARHFSKSGCGETVNAIA